MPPEGERHQVRGNGTARRERVERASRLGQLAS
jgi:hypothetical protein